MEKVKKIIGLDTNVVLTYRLERGKEFKIVNNLFKECLTDKIKLYIPNPVILETEWTLRSFYKQTKEQIIEFFEELLSIENMVTDNKEIVKFALNLYKQSADVSFTDCLILIQIKNHPQALFLTFDKQLGKLYQSFQ